VLHPLVGIAQLRGRALHHRGVAHPGTGRGGVSLRASLVIGQSVDELRGLAPDIGGGRVDREVENMEGVVREAANGRFNRWTGAS
jgi:hypothetical protein